MREAPSSIEYSVWRCRWTNESVRAPPSDLSSTGPVDRPVENHMSVITLPQVLRTTPESKARRRPISRQTVGRVSGLWHLFSRQTVCAFFGVGSVGGAAVGG